MQLDEFELLCDEPIYIEGVGKIKIPTLRDIRKISYKTYEMLCGYLSVDLNKYIDITGLREQYNNLNSQDKAINTLYNLIICNKEFREIYYIIFSFFISENLKFNTVTESFELYKVEFDEIKLNKNQIITGIINNENFDLVRDCLLQINRIKEVEIDNEPVIYKNEMARKLAERMAKAEKVRQEKNKDNMNFGKMISKYCADNKNGINLLNVYDMTIYQFLDQFTQNNHIRQSYIQDMVYANTVTFSDLKDYDSQLWLK